MLKRIVLFFALLLVLSGTVFAELAIKIDKESISAGDTIKITITPSTEFYKYLYLYDSEKNYITSITLPCLGERCKKESSKSFVTPPDWEGSYSLKVYDYDTNKWVSKIINVVDAGTYSDSDGLIAHYKFEDNANDETGKHNGTINGATFASGMDGKAAYFDGVDDMVTLPDNEPVWLPTENFSLSVWVYFNDDIPADYEYILDMNHGDSSSPPNELGYTLIRDKIGHIRFAMTTSNTDEDLIGVNKLDAGKWYHLVAVREGTSQKLYINTALDSSRTCEASPIDFVGNYDNNEINVGAFTRATNIGPIFFLDGQLDNLRIYNRALSYAEIVGLYDEEESVVCTDSDGGVNIYQKGTANSTINGAYTEYCAISIGEGEYVQAPSGEFLKEYFCDENGEVDDYRVEGGPNSLVPCPNGCKDGACLEGPIAYYPFEDNANDASGNGHDGVVNKVSFVDGKFGRAAYFRGVDGNYVNIGDLDILSKGDGTFCAWIKPESTSSYHTVFGERGNVGGSQSITYLQVWSDGKPRFGLWSPADRGNSYSTRGSSNLLDGSYHHMCAVRVRGENIFLYIDGALEGSMVDKYGDISNRALDYIGDETGSNNYYKGAIDEVRIYDRALSAAEIAELYGPVEEPVVCIDSDGKDEFVWGYANLTQRHEDYCSGDTKVFEYFCSLDNIIARNEYFYLPVNGEDVLFRYKGSDRCSSLDPKIEFDIVDIGQRIQANIDTSGNTATLVHQGKQFVFEVVDCSVDDSNITLIDNTLLMGERMDCSEECKDGVCVEGFDGYASVATLKDGYLVGEQIGLTDPPNKVAGLNSNVKGYSAVQSDSRFENDVPFNDLGIGGEVYAFDEQGNAVVSNALQDIINSDLIENYKGYIVQFEEKPILEKKKELEEKAKANEEYVENAAPYNPIKVYKQLFSVMPEDTEEEVVEYTKDLEKENELVKERILSKLGDDLDITGNIVGVKELIVRNEFKKTFNGISLDISEEQAEEIKKVMGVKGVYPNLEVKADLMDSVSLIGASDLWTLDKDGNDCTVSGQECLTGVGTTIGIIDTGIDYTHEDLGGCSIPLPDPSPTCFDPFEVNVSGCVEDDGGINFCHRGMLSFSDGRGAWDYCLGNALVERSCSADGTNYIETSHVCEEQCANGACVKFVNINEIGCEKVIGGYDFVNNDANPMDDHGHGTHCAGISAGNGVLKGVAPDAKLYALKVLSSGGSGNTDSILAAIDYATDPNGDGNYSDHLDVISLSLGGYDGGRSRHPDDALSQGIDNAVNLGVIVVISAGNSGPSQYSVGSPGTSRNAITVGATDDNDMIASFSSRGPVKWELSTKYINKPDIVAPGVNICSAQWENAWSSYQCVDDEHTSISGTSMAAPHVSGAAALLKQANPELNPFEVKSILKYTSLDIGYKPHEQGMGRLQLAIDNNLQNPPLYIQLELHRQQDGIIKIMPTVLENAYSSLTTFSIEYKDENDIDWTVIYQSNQLPDHEYLFDTSQLEDGIYTFRLSTTDSFGRNLLDEIFIEINQLVIYSPYDHSMLNGMPPVYRNGDTIELKGEVTKLDAQHYLEFYSRCGESLDWDNQGGTLTGDSEGVLATVDTSFVSGEIDCEFKLEYSHVGQLLSTASVKIHFDPTLYPGWPKRFPTYWDQISELPVVSDLENDGSIEVIYSVERQADGTPTKLYIMDLNGNDKYPPLTLPISSPGKISIADIDNDGFKDIIFREYSYSTGGYIYVVESNNEIKQGWPKNYNYLSFDSDIAIYDLDNDGNLEMVVADIDYEFPVAVLDNNGNELPGWPKYLDKAGGGKLN